eukprot:COSAG01_NODE_16950_length_1191_cov_1.387363_1_plen_29_part_10
MDGMMPAAQLMMAARPSGDGGRVVACRLP